MSNLINKRGSQTPVDRMVRMAQVISLIALFAVIGVRAGNASQVRASNASNSVDLQVLATGIASDGAGNIYYADTAHSRIYRVDSAGTQTPIQCCAGTSIALNQPRGLALDSMGNLYIANTGNNQVIEISPSGQASVVNTGFYRLSQPSDVSFDANGDLFIADSGNGRILEVAAAGGQASQVDTGNYLLSNPLSVSVGKNDALYIADSGNNRIIEVPASGAPSALFSNQLHNPLSVSTDSAGNAYISQTTTHLPSQNGSSGGGSMPAVVSSFSAMNLNVSTNGGSKESIASANVTLTPMGGYTGTVYLSVVGLPPNVLMQLTHPIVSFQGNAPVADRLVVGAEQQGRLIVTGIPQSPSSHGVAEIAFAGLLPFSVLMLIGFRASSRKLARASKVCGILTILLLLPMLSVTTSGCAGGYPAGLFGDATYTATLIAKPANGQPYSLGSFGVTVQQ